MNQIFSMLSKHNRQITVALVLAFCAALTDQLVPRFLRDLMNGLAGAGKDQTTTFLLLAMAGAYVGAQLLRVLQRVAVERAATRLGAELMSRGMSNLVGNSMAWHLDAPVGQVHVRLERSSHAIADLLKVAIGDIVGPLMGIAFALLLLFETSHLGGVAALIVALALCAITAWQISNQNGVRIAINRAREALGADIVDAVTNVETVKLCGAEATEAERVQDTSRALANREFMHHKAMAVFDMAKAVIDHGGFVLVIAAGVSGHWDASTPGALVLTVLCYQRLMEPLRSMHRIIDEVAERMALARDYLSLREAPQVPLADKPSMKPDCAISIRDVWYSYPHASKCALTGVSVDIPYQARVALVGSSGEGKSTLAKLLSGVLVPTEGTVSVDGARVQPIELQASNQRTVAVLSQEVRLFAGSVIDNIRYGAPDSSDEAVLRAAQAAGIGDLLFETDGTNRRVRARGEGVSGGQKQRIGIARVLLRGAPIVVLDEPTSAQDAVRRATFFDFVLKAFAKQTVVVITHDTANLDWATHVLRLREGKVVNESSIVSNMAPMALPLGENATSRLLGQNSLSYRPEMLGASLLPAARQAQRQQREKVRLQQRSVRPRQEEDRRSAFDRGRPSDWATSASQTSPIPTLRSWDCWATEHYLNGQKVATVRSIGFQSVSFQQRNHLTRACQVDTSMCGLALPVNATNGPAWLMVNWPLSSGIPSIGFVPAAPSMGRFPICQVAIQNRMSLTSA